MASRGKGVYGVSEQRIDCEFKVVLIGDFEVGRTQILAHCERKESKTGTTVTVEYETQTLSIQNKSVKAHIWGNVRQERYNVDPNAHYKDADGVILVYDITNRQSFDCMTLWLEDLLLHAKKKQAIILIGNKSDSEDDREVLRKDAFGFAKKKELLFLEISALEGNNFETAIKNLLIVLMNRKILGDAFPTSNSNNTTNSNNITNSNNTDSNNTINSNNTTTNENTNNNNSRTNDMKNNMKLSNIAGNVTIG